MSKFDLINTNRFDDNALKSAVDDATYSAWHTAIADGSALPKENAKALAKGISAWAIERGAVNFSHWFFPHRGMRAGTKLDAFIDLDFGSDSPLKPIVGEEFGASKLFISETDGSSFPNGGLRATHTAAAFMNWDRTSAPFVRGDTLYFPCAFTAWNGESLDYKTPLLRSQRAVSDESVRLLKHMGHDDVKKVHANVGWEQEFFVIPLEVYNARPDLVACERTVLGATPPREQQLSCDYFSKIQPRVRAYLEDLQTEMWKCGISNSVLHNEVAPSQHELSPIFALTNVSSDQNILCVELMEDLAADHDLKVLFHEKPFADVNGSGKHCNWGLNTDTGINLYDPGNDQEAFSAFTTALIHGLYNFPAIFRTSYASYGNDFRLGGHEAPPAILSMYAGPTLGAHLEAIANDGGPLAGYDGGRYGGKVLDSGAPELGPVGAGIEDRNRTAPVPFCGNRMEFRAVGSNQNISMTMTMANVAAAEGLSVISDKIEAGASPRDAVAEVLSDAMPVMFNGDGYHSDWHHEAENVRGLPNLPTTIDALRGFVSDKNKALFAKHAVYSPAEVESVTNIMYDKYAMDVQIEANTMIKMINQAILPACAADLKAYDGTNLAGDRPAAYKAIADATAALQATVDAYPADDGEEGAVYSCDVVRPAMAAVRAAHDVAECLIDSDKYPFPTYEQCLFGHHSDGRNF
jgi:glutamine synthetase